MHVKTVTYHWLRECLCVVGEAIRMYRCVVNMLFPYVVVKLAVWIVAVCLATCHPLPKKLNFPPWQDSLCDLSTPFPLLMQSWLAPDGLRVPSAKVLSDINIAFLGEGGCMTCNRWRKLSFLWSWKRLELHSHSKLHVHMQIICLRCQAFQHMYVNPPGVAPGGGVGLMASDVITSSSAELLLPSRLDCINCCHSYRNHRASTGKLIIQRRW